MEEMFSFPFIYRLLTSTGIGFTILLLILFSISDLVSGNATSIFDAFFNSNHWLFIPISISAIVLGEGISFLAEFTLLYRFFRPNLLPIGIRRNITYIERIIPQCSLSPLKNFFKKFSGIPSDISNSNSITIEVYKAIKVDSLLILSEIHYNLSRILASIAFLLLFCNFFYLTSVFSEYKAFFTIIELVLLIFLLSAPCLFISLLGLVILLEVLLLIIYSISHPDNISFSKLAILFSLQAGFFIFWLLSIHHRSFANRLLKLIEEKNLENNHS